MDGEDVEQVEGECEFAFQVIELAFQVTQMIFK